MKQEWEEIIETHDEGKKGLFRTKVPRGWLVRVSYDAKLTFIEDLNHEWGNDCKQK